MGKINIKEANKKIANMEAELAQLKALVANAKEREPRKIPYDLEDLVDMITTDSLDEELVVGDWIDINLEWGETVRMIVIGKEHDTMTSGKKADYTFGIMYVDILSKMNDESTNKGGWEKSKMRNVYLNRLAKLLPEELLENIVTVRKTTSCGEKSSKIITTEDGLFLFSEVEVYGSTSLSFAGEGSQYEYFKESENRKLKNYPWLRSPYSSGSRSFCCMCDDGCSSYSSADGSSGVAFGFCLSSLI